MSAAPRARVPTALARVHLQILLSRALVATSFTVGAAITGGLDPRLLTLLRFALAVVLFAPYVALRHGLRLPRPSVLLGYGAISACVVTFFWSMFEALRHTSPLNTSAIYTLVPGMSAVYAALLVRERLGAHRLAALGFGLAGALWVVFRGDPARLLALELNRGDAVFLLGCLAMGLYAPLVRLFHRGEPAAVMSFWVLATGTGWLVMLNHAATFTTAWDEVEPRVFAGIAYLAVFTTIVTFFIQQHATVHIGPTRVMSYSYLTPAMVVLVEWALGAGWPPPAVLPGIALIVAAMLVVQRGAGGDAAARR